MLHSYRDQPNTKREYETIYIVSADTTRDNIQSLNTRLRTIVDDAEGKLLRIENWGKRKLAYEIRRNQKGIYLYWRYLGSAQLVGEIERNLRLLDSVLRYLTVKIDEDIDPEARPSLVTETVFDAAAETRPDEEDYYLGRNAPSGASAAASESDETKSESDETKRADDGDDDPGVASTQTASEKPEIVARSEEERSS